MINLLREKSPFFKKNDKSIPNENEMFFAEDTILESNNKDSFQVSNSRDEFFHQKEMADLKIDPKNSPFYDLPKHLINDFRKILMSFLNKGHIPSWDECGYALLSSSEYEREILKSHFYHLIRWDFLAPLLKKNYQEYFFHGPHFMEAINRFGQKEQINSSSPFDDTDWQLWLEIISSKFKQNWNVRSPFCSFYGEVMDQHYRFSLLHQSTGAENKSKLFLRSISSTPFDVASFGHSEKLVELVQEQKNILIAGATGSGKTSLLSSLIHHIDPEEHLIILEDTHELICQRSSHTSLISGDQESNNLKSYMAYAMRLSPDRIILGEMRSKEVVPYVLAMNTGHRGLMSTVHATSAADALYRIVLLFSLYSENNQMSYEHVMNLITRNIEYVVFVKNKKVTEMIKVLGSENGVPFYELCS